MSLRYGMWHGLRNDIILQHVMYGKWRKEINKRLQVAYTHAQVITCAKQVRNACVSLVYGEVFLMSGI